MPRSGANIDMEAVRIFVAVVQCGDFTKAAKKTGLTRSAIGKTIARLEASLGIRLLHRTTRRIMPTSDGEAMHDRFAPILRDIEDAETSMQAGEMVARGTLRLTMPDAYGRVRVLPILQRYLERWPDVSAIVSLTDHILDIVDDGLDVAIRIGAQPIASGIISRTIDTIEGVHCAAPTYLKDRGLPQTPKGLEGHDLLEFSGPRRFLTDLPVQDCSAAQRRVRATYDSAEALKISCLAGLGIAYLPRVLIETELADGRLIAVPLSEGPILADVRVLYPAKRHLAPRVRLFIDQLVDELGRTPI